jgi:alcohol/geraniol dehydrogenase (NADP+)
VSAIRAWAAKKAGGPLERFEYTPAPLGLEDVEVEIDYCGICHSDLSMLYNEWSMTTYPFVPGHEAIGRVVALGDIAEKKGLSIGQRVGVGWNSSSCLHCERCVRGHHHLCTAVQPTIVGHHGAFADRVRAHWIWVIPIPYALDPSSTGPMLCGGITVFAPLMELNVTPTSRVGVFGIGGLGHMALMFLNAWGCQVTAFSSSPSKTEEAKSFGAHRVASSRDPKELKTLAGTFDFIFITANTSLDWDAVIGLLAPRGRLHILGAVLEPIPVQAFSLISGESAISGSPTGTRSNIDTMLRFASLHHVAPKVEHFPMSRVNDAMAHLRAGKANYRVVLDADFER